MVQKIRNPDSPINFDNYQATVGVDCKVLTSYLEDLEIKSLIWDVSGQDKYRTMIASQYLGAAQILFVFNVNDTNSFNKIKSQYLNEYLRFANKATPPALILVGTQCEVNWGSRVPMSDIDDLFSQTI